MTSETPRVASIPTRRILVIDDELPIQEIVRSCFEDLAGWNVLTACSGAEGLLTATADPPDAIVLDVMMPGMDGLTFVQQLRTRSETQQIPVVLLTARADLIQGQRYPINGIVGAIGKPFDPIALVNQVAALLGWALDQPLF